MPEPALRTLFLIFLRLGATAYGGPAMMAWLRREFVERRRWITEQEFKDGLALCHMIPGATMVQMATYVGYRLRRLSGALVAAAGFILPAFLLMVGLSAAYFTWANTAPVRAVFTGLAAIVVAIILHACLSLSRTIVQGWQGAVLTVVAFCALAFGANILLVLAGAALLALALYRVAPSSAGPTR